MVYNITTFVLAGGKGERLFPLTRCRAKPLLPFGESRRLIDFTIANCDRSELSIVQILTCNDCISVNLNAPRNWIKASKEMGRMMDGVSWLNALKQPGYSGTADAVRQNLWRVSRGAREVLVLASDHVYSMDYRPLIEFHRQKGAWVTVGAAEVDWLEARHYGVLETDDQDRIVNFAEKPRITDDEIGRSPTAKVSMGIYLFDVDFLSTLLHSVDGKDFGHDLLPVALASRNVFAFNPSRYEPESFFWRDVGTLHSYWKTQMEWIKGQPRARFPRRAVSRHSPVGEGEIRDARYLGGLDPLVWKKGNQTLPSRRIYGDVSNTVVHPSALVFSTAEVSDSILLEGAVIYPGARVRRAIIDRNAVVQSFEEVGFDLVEDAKNHLVTPEGLVVVSGRQPEILSGNTPSLGGDIVESSMTIG